jgi:hypothetical protein
MGLTNNGAHSYKEVDADRVNVDAVGFIGSK